MEGNSEGLSSRRGFLQKAGLGAAVAWTAPSIVSVGAAAAATAAPFAPLLLTGAGSPASGAFLTMSAIGTAAYRQASALAWDPTYGPVPAPFAPPPVLLAGDDGGRVMALDATGATTISVAGGPFSVPVAGPPIGVPVLLAANGGSSNPSTFLAMDAAGLTSLWIDAGPWGPALAAPPIGPVVLLASWGVTGGFTVVDAAGGGAYMSPPQPWLAIAGAVPFQPLRMTGTLGNTIVTGPLGATVLSVGGGPWSNVGTCGVGAPSLLAAGAGTVVAVDALGNTDFGTVGGWGGASAPPGAPVGAPAFLAGDEVSGNFLYMDALGNAAEAPPSGGWGAAIPPPS